VDFTDYLPEKLKIQYDETGTPATVLEKVLELFAQVLSGDVSATHDFESKINEIENFWNPYGLNDLTKLKRTLDINNIVETVSELNEACAVSSSENSEKAYLKTIPIFNKMKGTLKGLINVLNLFGISISVLPWYDSEFPAEKYQECGIIVNANLEGNVCLTEDSYEIIQEIISMLLDVCARLVELILRKLFVTHFDDLEEELAGLGEVSSLCLHWDWRTAHPCCNTWGMANSGNYAFYSSHTLDRCPASFDHSGGFIHKCHESLWCGMERVDVAVVDPIIRSCAEVPIESITYQGGHIIRYTVPSGFDFVTVKKGDTTFISFADNDESNGEFKLHYVESTDDYFEVVNSSISNDTFDEYNSGAVAAINLTSGVNRVILDHGYPVRTVVYDDPFIPGVDLGDSVGDGTLYAVNELIGDQWVRAGNYWECPDLFSATHSILNTDRIWSLYASDSVGDEYYLILEDMSFGLDIMPEPADVIEGEVYLTRGVFGSLQPGEWDFGGDTVIGYNTIVVKLFDGSNPNTKDTDYLQASVLKRYCQDTEKEWADETNYLV
jgi:hypothetical protein